MKYRIKKAITKRRRNILNARFRAKRNYGESAKEPIDFSSLFDFPEQHEVPLPIVRKKPSFFTHVIFWLKSIFQRASARLKSIVKKKRERRKKRSETIYMLSGALCSSVLVTLLSIGIVFVSLFWRYKMPYTTVTVPNFVGTIYEDNEEDTNELFSYVIDYEYNPNVTPGRVISQSPPAGTQRKVYSNGKYCLISLTVSHAKEVYTLEELSGKSERDASLLLRNNGLVPKIIKEYSSTVPRGTVIKSFPEVNKPMADGDCVTLTVSLGPQVILCAVPNIVGLTEIQAIPILKSAGLLLGKITYIESTLPAGTVVSQSIPAKSAIKANSKVDITVSIGEHRLKTVPNLYGKTLEDAKDILRSYGLVLGTQIYVGSAEEKGTIISQTPLPNTPITSSTVSVDVYVSY